MVIWQIIKVMLDDENSISYDPLDMNDDIIGINEGHL